MHCLGVSFTKVCQASDSHLSPETSAVAKSFFPKENGQQIKLQDSKTLWIFITFVLSLCERGQVYCIEAEYFQ